MQTLGLVVEVKTTTFSKRLSTFLPIMLDCLSTCVESISDTSDGGAESKAAIAITDQLLHHQLVVLEKVFTHCGHTPDNDSHCDLIVDIWGEGCIKSV